jgi:hypothetical protein
MRADGTSMTSLSDRVVGLLGTGGVIVAPCPFCPRDVHYIDVGGLTILAACQRTAKGELKDPCDGRRILAHIGLTLSDVTPARRASR